MPGSRFRKAFVRLAQKSICAYNLTSADYIRPSKNERNVRDRGLSFELAAEFEFETARVEADVRCDYGETRYVAIGKLSGRLHVLCFTDTSDGIRVISFRKANDREMKEYAKSQTID